MSQKNFKITNEKYHFPWLEFKKKVTCNKSVYQSTSLCKPFFVLLLSQKKETFNNAALIGTASQIRICKTGSGFYFVCH